MNGTIELLNVGDGDAIIVSLDKENKNLIVVIDGGENRDYLTKVKPALEKLLLEKEKKAPDIVVATHYDSDHIGGLIPLIDDYIQDISEVWVHRSPELSREVTPLLEVNKESNTLRSPNSFLFKINLIAANSSISEEAIATKSDFIITSLKQLETFLGKIPKAKVKHVYHGYSFAGWPELKVLGPTEAFYKSLFPKTKSLEQLIIEETIDYSKEDTINNQKRIASFISSTQNPCENLKTDTTAKLTPTNKASIILAIDKGNKRFLFTGDAGITSFKKIPNWQQELANIYWLKIPHHGSDNNISTEIISVMKPEYADNSGDSYQDNYVLDCIASNERSIRAPRSTKNGGDLSMTI